MTSPNILADTTPTVDPAEPTAPRCVITDAWGLVFAQGGVVMAAALRAMEAVLDRDDLSLSSASATFVRPVACGPVTTQVEVLRDGRRGAQVHGMLADQSAVDGQSNVAVTAVFTDPSMEGPVRTPLECPVELAEPPDPDASSEHLAVGNSFPLGFLDNTEWCVAPSPAGVLGDEGPIPRLAVWFRFTDPPAAPGDPWDPALLPIPGDALGSALVVALGSDGPVGSVSLQIGIQVFAPATGSWVGIDSRCTHVGNGLASGVLDLWSETGEHVATLTQTAMLRTL